MKNNLFLITLLSLTMLIISCTSASEDDLINTTPMPEVITYEANVKSIIGNNCIVCHSNPPQNGAPMPLVFYENVKEAVENRNLIGRISSEDPSFLMPLGGPRLPQNLIDIIIQWNEDGLIKE
jgi:hypothetical protein